MGVTIYYPTRKPNTNLIQIKQVQIYPLTCSGRNQVESDEPKKLTDQVQVDT